VRLEEEETALGVTGPQAGELLVRMGLPALAEPLTHTAAEWHGKKLRIVRSYGSLAEHYEIWVEKASVAELWTALKEAGATPVGTVSLEAWRIAEGIPAYGIDMMERDLPQETSQERALHYSKGCYVGQEIVERIHSRGNISRHLRQLELDGPLPAAGTELKYRNAAGTEIAAGTITSAAELRLPGGVRRLALGMIRAEAELRNPSFAYDDGTGSGHAQILIAPPGLTAQE
jgi:folate-binding protein YgfZ